MSNISKLVVVINGSGGVGKDTMCDVISRHFKTANISSIDPIKRIAAAGGWRGEKDEKSRNLLSQLKKLFIDFNDISQTYISNIYKQFMADDKDCDILFVHIREPEEIEKFKNIISGNCVTLLIKRESTQKWNNKSDDRVENYQYDFYYENTKKIEEVEADFLTFFKQILDNPYYNREDKGGTDAYNYRRADE